jgi:cystathionine beta-lyase/cystathionine gamma-synthase
MKFGTKVIHAGIKPDPSTGAIMTPIYQTSTYVQDSPGVHKGYEYARTQNPTRDVLQNNLAALENGKYGICFSSGLAALDVIMKTLKPGDDILSGNDLYGGSFRQMRTVFGPFGIQSRFIPMNDLDYVADSIQENTKLIWLETPTNPMLNIIDIEGISRIANEKGILVAVDNTFASPYLQTPLDLGVDIVHHSVTKYIGGHSDVIMGALVVNNKELADQYLYLQNACGAIPGPQDCFLTLRGIKTLHLRMDRSCQNATEVANFLNNHPKVSNVHFPGLSDHPQHSLAAKQMKDFGAMLSFELKDDSIEAAHDVLNGTKLFSLAESLGGVESLIGHPASMTHASIPKEERMKVGLTDSLIRLSIGIEDINDLKEDLENAL